jgi:serine/threonine protein kinase
VIVTAVDPLIGTTIGGHYEIEALVGVGAMGRVYRAHHTRLVNKRYALKVLFGELTASPTMRIRFAHEAESASKLDHPNIVGVLDFGCTDAGLMYLVMDIVDGPTLGGLIDQGPMSSSRVVAIARQLCAGLAHAHERGIVHRDFKPDNILVSSTSSTELLRIADFGLAISRSDEDDDARLTGTGVLCTPTYAAPEQLLGHDIDHRADLYALGVTLYEMLTGGVLPFARGSQEVMLWKVTTEWPHVSARAPTASPGLASLIRGLLAREPSARPASAQDVIDALDKIAATPERVSARMSARWHAPRTRPAMVVGSIVALFAAVALLARAALIENTPTAAASVATTDVSAEPIRTRAAPSVMRETSPPEPAVEELAPEEPAATAPPHERANPARAPVSPSRRPAASDRIAASTATPVSTSQSTSTSERIAASATPVSTTITVEPAPVRVEQPAPVAPTLPPPAPIETVRVPAPPVAPVVARPPRIVELQIDGALAPSVVRRALDRVLPALQACTDKVGARVVSIRFAIEETRRAVHVRAAGAGAACVAATLGSMRTDTAPDVGEVSVTVRLSFGGGA